MKRWVLAAVLWALSGGVVWAGAVKTAPIRTAPAQLGHLSALGAMLGAMPGLSSPGTLTAPALTPAVLDMSRAAVQAPAGPEAALRTLEAVNAALKDFSPEELRSRPAEQLSRLAGLVMDRAAALPAAVVPERVRAARLIEAARRSTRQAVDRLLALKAKGVSVSKVLASTDRKTITEYRGVPDRVRELETRGRVFRHWIRDEAVFQEIKRTGILRAGPTSYVEFTGGRGAFIKDIYPDLRGVFFTLPGRSSAEPRVMNEALPYYIDFVIPEGVAALRLDGDDVLMVPAETGAEIPVRITGSSAGS